LTRDLSNPLTPDFIWIPRYNSNNGTLGPSLPNYPTDLWQYTSSGTIPGISGRVDLSVLYDQRGNRLSDKTGNTHLSLEWLSTP